MLSRTAFIILALMAFQFGYAQEEPAKVIKGLKARVTSITVSPKEDKLLVTFGQYAALYDIEKGKKVATFEHDYNNCSELYYGAFDDDGDQVVTVDAKGKRRYWDAGTGELLITQKAKFGPDPQQVIAMGLKKDNPSSSYYYVQTETEVPGSKIVIKAKKKGVIHFVNTADDNKVVRKIELKNSDMFHLPPCVIGPDGEYLITGTDKGEIHFYSLN